MGFNSGFKGLTINYDTEISMSGKNLPSYVTMDHLICLLFQTDTRHA